MREIRVLVLVDQDVPEAFVQRLPDLRVITQQNRHMQQQIVEIHGGGFEQLLLISRIDLGNNVAQRKPDFGLVSIRFEQFVLCSADFRGHLARSERRGIVVDLLQHVF